ncbi:MAG: radical SAM protein, partial [Bacilli bacterium]|nr:radical SAM protein [Bacilli bacterium]
GKLCQIFMYLIDECNLACEQCLYKPNLAFQFCRKEIPYNEAKELLQKFYNLGANKITFMGGEPTLYKELPQLVADAKRIGYTYIRIDTNGIFSNDFLENKNIKKVDEITFSLDGYNEKINSIRGIGAFQKCVDNIRNAVRLKYKVQVTCCIHQDLVKKDRGKLGILRMIDFIESLGVGQINFHDLLKVGVPRDVWTGKISPSYKDYVFAMKEVGKYNTKIRKIKIRLPQRLIKASEFRKNINYYGYCSGKQKDRLLVFPDGTIRICSLLIGSPYHALTYDKKGIYLNDSPTNELIKYNTENSPCVMGKNKSNEKDLLLLCIAFKSKQDEPIWKERLMWEKRNK